MTVTLYTLFFVLLDSVSLEVLPLLLFTMIIGGLPCWSGMVKQNEVKITEIHGLLTVLS